MFKKLKCYLILLMSLLIVMFLIIEAPLIIDGFLNKSFPLIIINNELCLVQSHFPEKTYYKVKNNNSKWQYLNNNNEWIDINTPYPASRKNVNTDIYRIVIDNNNLYIKIADDWCRLKLNNGEWYYFFDNKWQLHSDLFDFN